MPLFLEIDGVALQMPMLEKLGYQGPSDEINSSYAHFWSRGRERNTEYRVAICFDNLTVAKCVRDYHHNNGALTLESLRNFRKFDQGQFSYQYHQFPGRFIGAGEVSGLGTVCFMRDNAFSFPQESSGSMLTDLTQGYVLKGGEWEAVEVLSARVNSPAPGDTRIETVLGTFQFYGDDSFHESSFAPSEKYKTNTSKIFRELTLDQISSPDEKKIDIEIKKAFDALGVLAPWPPARWWGDT